MNRITTAMLAALEALIAVAIGIGVSLVPLTLLWAIQYGFSIDWMVFWRASVDIWLLGNGVDLRVTLPAELVARIGLPGAAAPFFVTVTPLAFSAFSVVMGIRAGRKAARTRYGQTAVISALLSFLALSTLATVSAMDETLRPSIVQGLIVPPLIFGFGVIAGVVFSRLSDEITTDVPLTRLIDRVADAISDRGSAILSASLRGATIAVAGLIGISAVALALLLLMNFGLITGLYESAQLGIAGGATTTVAQFAFLPNLVIWVAAWFIGPGFALGAGTSISPVGTMTGPIPAVPIFGALPSGDFAFGFIGLVVPLVAGFFAASIVRQRLIDEVRGRGTIPALLTAAVGIGAVTAIAMGLLAWLSGGAIGPGRLAEIGPNPWLVALFAFAEVTIAAAIGMVSGNTSTTDAPAGAGRASERLR